MEKQSRKGVWAVTALFILSLVVLVVCSIAAMQRQTEENCFRYLSEATHRLADDLYKTTDMDATVLTAMASILASESDASNSRLCQILNSYDSVASYVSYTELLRPDDTILDSDGTVRDVSGTLHFAQESARGAYISNMEYSTKSPETRIIRNAVPVVRDGQTIYMLYGVVVLSDFAEAYTTNIYDGNAYVYLVDGNTGDFLLDTWHNSFGNMADFYGRKMLSQSTFQDAAANMQNGTSGDLAFISESTGDTLYLHYEPVGVNNWSVLVTVQEKYALADSEAVNRILYHMAAIAGVQIFAYMVFIVSSLLRAYRSIRKIGLSDRITGLQNRNAYDAFVARGAQAAFPLLTCIYIDVNGLHELNNTHGHAAGDKMLQHVADALKAEFAAPTIFRAGGDEFVVLAEDMGEEACQEKMHRADSAIAAQGYSIAYGIAVQKDATGYGSAIRAADEAMLANKKLYYQTHDRRAR